MQGSFGQVFLMFTLAKHALQNQVTTGSNQLCNLNLHLQRGTTFSDMDADKVTRLGIFQDRIMKLLG